MNGSKWWIFRCNQYEKKEKGYYSVYVNNRWAKRGFIVDFESLKEFLFWFSTLFLYLVAAREADVGKTIEDFVVFEHFFGWWRNNKWKGISVATLVLCWSRCFYHVYRIILLIQMNMCNRDLPGLDTYTRTLFYFSLSFDLFLELNLSSSITELCRSPSKRYSCGR